MTIGKVPEGFESAPGGRLSSPDPDRFDEKFPEMKFWAEAGVSGGIPVSQAMKPSSSVDPSFGLSQIQHSIDEASNRAGSQPAVVEFAPGTYRLDEPLKLRSNVVLRGSSVENVFIDIRVRHTWNLLWTPEPVSPAGIHAEDVCNAGIENMTIQYDRELPRPKSLRYGEQAFDDDPEKDNPYYVQSVVFHRCANCWIQNCRIIDSGSSPLCFVRSTHCSARWCEIFGARNKHGGMAYVNLSRSSQCLLTSLWVRDIRHVGIQNEEPEFPSKYNVVYGCDLEVDVNFHNGDSGHNLVEGNRIAIPTWHWWGPFAYGVKGHHMPPGRRNMLYRNEAYRRRITPYVVQSPCPDPHMVYEMKSDFDSSLTRHDPPRSGTLYAVKAIG